MDGAIGECGKAGCTVSGCTIGDRNQFLISIGSPGIPDHGEVVQCVVGNPVVDAHSIGTSGDIGRREAGSREVACVEGGHGETRYGEAARTSVGNPAGADLIEADRGSKSNFAVADLEVVGRGAVSSPAAADCVETDRMGQVIGW